MLACTNSHVSVPCRDESDCVIGQICAEVRRGVRLCTAICPDAVYDGEHCADGSQCIDGVCYDPGQTLPGEPCYALGECVDGYACSRLNGPVTPTCVPTCIGVHHDDSECLAGTICHGIWSICVPPCDYSPAGTCPYENQICITGQCQNAMGWQSCNDPDLTLCPLGQACDQATYECLEPVEYDRRHPRPEGGVCHLEPACPANPH